MEKDIFDIITEYAVNGGMNSILLQDEEYIKIQKEIDEKMNRFDRLNLTKEQRLIVDEIISAYNDSGAFYGAVTYKKGLRDCVVLLQELNLLKVS